MQFFKFLFLSAALVVVFLPGFSFAEPSALPVAVSIPPQKYMLERIGGDAVSVTVLLAPGADPHSYEPGPSQLREVAKTAAWFTIGVPFEDIWLPRIQGAFTNLRVVSSLQDVRRLPFAEPIRTVADLRKALADSATDLKQNHDHSSSARGETQPLQPDARQVADAHDHSHDHNHPHDGEDPHVWLSPAMVRAMLPCLARELGERMPDKAEIFRANAATFDAELEALDQELESRFSAIPAEKRVFLTVHPSWRYFAYAYRLIELSIEVEGKEPGPKSLKDITDIAKELGITTVFVEPQFPRASARAVANAIGASVVQADPLEEDLPALYRGMADKLLHSFGHE